MSSSVPYIGSKISLISNSEIRYEGILYTINTQESTIALQSVRCFGTEGRKMPEIPPSSEVYDFIIFRGQDIKDLTVLESNSAVNDPAIVSINQKPAGKGGAKGGAGAGAGGGGAGASKGSSGGGGWSSGGGAWGGGGGGAGGAGGYGGGGGSGGWGGWGSGGGSGHYSSGYGGGAGYGSGYGGWGGSGAGKGGKADAKGGKKGAETGKGGKADAKGGKKGPEPAKGGKAGVTSGKGGKDAGKSGGKASGGDKGKGGDKGSGKKGGDKGGGKRSGGRSGGAGLNGIPVGELQPEENAEVKEKVAEDFDVSESNKKFDKVSTVEGVEGFEDRLKPLPGYDKTKSFFDSISCEATERPSESERPKIDREKAREFDKETFGDTRRPPRPAGGRPGKGRRRGGGGGGKGYRG